MNSAYFIAVVVFFVVVLAFGFVQLTFNPKAVRHADGTVSIGYYRAPTKEYVRFTAIAAFSVFFAAAFATVISV